MRKSIHYIFFLRRFKMKKDSLMSFCLLSKYLGTRLCSFLLTSHWACPLSTLIQEDLKKSKIIKKIQFFFYKLIQFTTMSILLTWWGSHSTRRRGEWRRTTTRRRRRTSTGIRRRSGSWGRTSCSAWDSTPRPSAVTDDENSIVIDLWHWQCQLKWSTVHWNRKGAESGILLLVVLASPWVLDDTGYEKIQNN